MPHPSAKLRKDGFNATKFLHANSRSDAPRDVALFLITNRGPSVVFDVTFIGLFRAWVRGRSRSIYNGQTKMKFTWIAGILAVSVCSVVSIGVSPNLAAQDQVDSQSPALLSLIKEGKFSGEARYRFEAFERD